MTSALSLLLVVLITNYSSGNSHELQFSYITTITGGIRAIGGKPVVDLALEEINNRSDILQNYTLNYTTIRNSECTRTGALNAFFEDFSYTGDTREDTYVALLCCGCSPATIPIAEISHYWNIPQIAYAAAANELTDRSRFPNFFRALPSFEFIGASLAELVRQFEWRQLAIISQDESLFTSINAILAEIFMTENWNLDISALITSNEEYFSQDGLFPFEEAFVWMESGDFRVIHINAYAEYAYMVLCKAYELGLFPPRYVWITPMWYNREWWKPISEKITFACTESQLLQVLIGSIGVVPDGYFLMDNETATIFTDQTPTNFIQEYQRRLSQTQYEGLEELGIGGVVYDTIWSMALGLDRAIDKIAQNNDSGCENLVGDIVPLEDFNYTNEKLGCILQESLAETQFTGITGPIVFNSFGSRPDNVLLVQQYRMLDHGSVDYIERETVAEIVIAGNTQLNRFIFRSYEAEATLWASGVPYDGSSEDVIHANNIALAGVYYSLATFGILFVVTCLVFNIVFRNKKVVKLSSPNLNYLILVGAALLYVCVYLFVTPISNQSTANVLCNLRLWVFSLGYTLCFAVILSKTWRIYHIFNNPTAKKKSIKDWLLLVIIAVIVAADLTILLIGTAIPSSRMHATRVVDKETSQQVTANGINQDNYVYVCSTGNSVIWIGVSFAYKGLLQIVAIFMAFHTRRVKIKALNDSKETGAIIYINSIILVLIIVAAFVLEGYHNIHAALFGLALLVQASIFLGLLFIPKAINLYKDPQGNNVFTISKTQEGITTNNYKSDKPDDSVVNNTVLGNDPQETIRNLKEQVKALETKLTQSTATCRSSQA